MEALQTAGIDFNCNFLFGGQIKGERPRLFHIYAAGNFIESTSETCYFQIGESKYGKPILDRVVKFTTPLNLATKCVLVSMDSTINSNISVGLPLDLVVYEKDKLSVNKMVTIDKDNPYFDMMHNQWADKLKAVFMQIPEPVWDSNKKTISINTPTKKIEPIPIQEEKQARSKTRAKPSSKARK
jgi:putative proteasome-type protease